MPPAATKANYKTYEAQARLVRAIVAAHPEVRWNYKDIAKCFGSDMSEHALNHRFRVIRTQTEIIQRGLISGYDMKDLPVEPDGNPKTIESIDANIATYFGASTGDGIGFQFRSIKSDAKRMIDAVKAGQDPNSVAVTTVPGQNPDSATATPRSAAKAAARTPGSRVRKSTKKPEVTPLSFSVKSEAGDDDDDNSEIDTPTKPRDKVIGGRVGKKPPRAAASRASTKITQQASPPTDLFEEAPETPIVAKLEPGTALNSQPPKPQATMVASTDRNIFAPVPAPAPVAASAPAPITTSIPASTTISTSVKPAYTGMSLFNSGLQTPVSAQVFDLDDPAATSFGLPSFSLGAFDPLAGPLQDMGGASSFDDLDFADGEF